MKIYKPILFIILLGIGTISYAQQLSLDSCMSLALQNNVAIKNADLDVRAAQEVKKQVFTKYFPNVSAMAAAYHALEPLIQYGIEDVGSAEVRQFLYNMYYEYGAALGLPNELALCENGVVLGATAIQPIFMGGQIVNGNKLAKVGVQAAELQKELAVNQQLLQVEANYWLVKSLQEKQKTLQQALTFLDTLYRDVQTARAAGLVTQNDLLKVSLKQNELKSNSLKVDNGVKLATMALCQFIGVQYADNIELTDTIENENFFNFSSSNDSAAVASRNEAHLLNLQVDAAQLQKKITLGETLPHLMLGVGASYGNPIFDHYGANGLAFATLNIPITSWWETSHKLKQHNVLIQKAENERDDLMQKMQLEAQQARNNYQEAVAQVELMEESVALADANLQTAVTNYQAGLIPIAELLEAQTMYCQAKDQLTDAQIDAKIKLEKYKLSVGMKK